MTKNGHLGNFLNFGRFGPPKRPIFASVYKGLAEAAPGSARRAKNEKFSQKVTFELEMVFLMKKCSFSSK